MSLGVARDFSIPDLLCVLNEKLGLESSHLREMRLPPTFSTSSLKAEVSTPLTNPPQQTWSGSLNTESLDREPRNPSTRRFGPHTFFTEHVAASEQATPGGRL